MKPLKLGLRIWIAFTAAVSFLMGWAMLAHSGKPAPVSALAPVAGSASSNGPLVLPTLPPVPSLDQLTSGQAPQQQVQPLQQFSIQQSPSFGSAMPGLRTRGS